MSFCSLIKVLKLFYYLFWLAFCQTTLFGALYKLFFKKLLFMQCTAAWIKQLCWLLLHLLPVFLQLFWLVYKTITFPFSLMSSWIDIVTERSPIMFCNFFSFLLLSIGLNVEWKHFILCPNGYSLNFLEKSPPRFWLIYSLFDRNSLVYEQVTSCKSSYIVSA